MGQPEEKIIGYAGKRKRGEWSDTLHFDPDCSCKTYPVTKSTKGTKKFKFCSRCT